MATKKASKPNFLTAMFEKAKRDKEPKGKEGGKKDMAADKKQKRPAAKKRK